MLTDSYVHTGCVCLQTERLRSPSFSLNVAAVLLPSRALVPFFSYFPQRKCFPFQRETITNGLSEPWAAGPLAANVTAQAEQAAALQAAALPCESAEQSLLLPDRLYCFLSSCCWTQMTEDNAVTQRLQQLSPSVHQRPDTIELAARSSDVSKTSNKYYFLILSLTQVGESHCSVLFSHFIKFRQKKISGYKEADSSVVWEKKHPPHAQ